MNKKNHHNEKVTHLIGQMASFKCEENYYSAKYSSSYVKPQTWWQMINDPADYLKSLAMKLFSITPHSAACERAFSTLGFLYGNRRQCLNLSTMEMMVKIKYFLHSNVKGELNHFINEETEAELKALVEECGFFNDDDDVDDGNENNFYFDNDGEELEIPSHNVQVLIINNLVDMSHYIFTGELQSENNNSLDENEEDVEGEELDFEIISRISAPPNM